MIVVLSNKTVCRNYAAEQQKRAHQLDIDGPLMMLYEHR